MDLPGNPLAEQGGRGGADTRALQAFRNDYGARCPGGLLLHDGADVQWLADRILGVPWHHVV